MPLKRLLSKAGLRSEPPPGDVAGDEWAPVPVGATAEPIDTFEWLQGDGVPPKPVHPILTLDDTSVPEATPEHLQHFSAEELAIIEEQKKVVEPPSMEGEPEPEPLFKLPQPKTQEAAPEQKSEPVKLQQIKPVKPERVRWLDLLRNCGEHLSELELKIIREQLASS